MKKKRKLSEKELKQERKFAISWKRITKREWN